MAGAQEQELKRHAGDYIIVGGGTAGAVVARRLADAGAQVVLLEEGPSGEDDPLVRELARARDQWGTALLRNRPIVASSGGNPDLIISSGVVLGGCSSHNGCVAFQPPDLDFSEWEQLGAAGWGAPEMRSAFERIRSTVNLELPEPLHPAAADFVEAGVAAGLPLVDLVARVEATGIGPHLLNKRGPLRESSAAVYLYPLGNHPRLDVRCGVRVQRLIVDGDGVTGVDTDAGCMLAAQEVIVCAGAIGSPELLLKSGIGALEQLEMAGVSPRHELDGVGEHFIDHPEATVMWTSSRPVPDTSLNHFEASAFDTIDGGDRPDLQIMFGTARLAPIVETLARRHGIAPPRHVLAMYPNVARPRSHGRVRLVASWPEPVLELEPAYYGDSAARDATVMVEGIRLARRIASNPPLSDWIESEIAPGATASSDEELAAYVRGTAGTVYHQAGTCRMGAADDRDAVVDPRLRVRGLPGLRVADASVFPSIPSVNPCLTCMAVGERCAELVLTADSGTGDPASAAGG